MELTGPIESAEKQFIQILERYFISIYDEKKLPSHGLSHHRRVWTNSKKLLLSLPERHQIHPRLPFTLIIACYMHDLGMTIDHGPKHGKQSMELCRAFIRDYQLEEDDFPGLQHAIQEHDNKNYTLTNDINALSILSMADDLDAFGFIGIYRYTEIYLLRGIEPIDLGHKIRSNAFQRFEHFRKIFEYSGGFFEEQKRRYLVLDGFFEAYDKELACSPVPVNGLHYGGLIRILTDIISERRNIEDACLSDLTGNPVAQWFFKGFSEEISVYH